MGDEQNKTGKLEQSSEFAPPPHPPPTLLANFAPSSSASPVLLLNGQLLHLDGVGLLLGLVQRPEELIVLLRQNPELLIFHLQGLIGTRLSSGPQVGNGARLLGPTGLAGVGIFPVCGGGETNWVRETVFRAGKGSRGGQPGLKASLEASAAQRAKGA